MLDKYIMTIDGPQTLDYIEAHALNILRTSPDHVDANDKLALVREVRRLRDCLRMIAARDGEEAP